MRERLTARVLLLDAAGRILLMKGRLPSDPAGPGAWFTVGGGVEPDETLEAAAGREILEETGFVDAMLEREVWSGHLVVGDGAGGVIRVEEHFFLARCEGGEPSRAGWLSHEHALVDAIRWWTLAELAASEEPVFPRDLPARLAEILSEAGRGGG
jgi:8-oxo-dGTP pyrophosphatase MutT (NUDIX family)